MKKLIIALVLAVVMVLSLGAPVLAWDEEDTLVASNEDFGFGSGIDYVDDGQVVEYHYGEQQWYGSDADGYNLYRGDVTDTGNLDFVTVITKTPDKIDLPYWSDYWGGTMRDESPNTWYWDIEARGYDYPPVIVPPKPKPNYWLDIILPYDSQHFKRKGTVRRADINFSDGVWRISIPARVQIWKINTSGEYCGAAEKLEVDEGGNIISNIRCLNTDLYGEITVTRVD